LRFLKSIALELGVLFFIIAMLPILSTYFITNNIVEKSLKEESKQKMLEIAESAHLRIESYIQNIISDGTTLAKIPTFIDVLLQKRELNKNFIEYLKLVSSEKGYYDILLVKSNGDVIFTLKKEEDLGLNIHGPMLKETELYKTIKSSNTLLQSEVSNFAYYPPSKKSAAFLSVPIFSEGHILGNIVLQIDNDEFYKIINRYSGLGQSGEIIVGSNAGKSFHIAAPTRYNKNIQTQEVDKNKFVAISKALEGEQGSGTYIDYRGKEVLAVWRYLPSLNLGMSVKIDTEELYAPVESFKKMTLYLSLILIILVFLGVFLMYRMISRPIIRLANEVAQIDELQLPEKIESKSRHEIQSLIDSFNKLITSVRSYQFKLEDKVKERTIELNSSYEMLEKLTQNVPGTLFQYKLFPDGHSSFPYASNGIKDIYEVEPQDVAQDAQPVFNILHPDDLNKVINTIQSSAKTMNNWNIQYRVNLPKKGTRWVEGFSKPENLEDGSILWYGYIHDITDRKNTENKIAEQKNSLHYQAHHDALTGLPNRILFQDRLEQAIEKAKRNNSKIALLFIDLDHFKEINDSLGHDIGDDILKIVTTRLKAAKRDEDTLARLGGDEFTIILEDLHQGQDASLISNKILESLAQSININNNILYVSSSIGISIYPDDGDSAQSLLKFADSAMYKAKDEGRNNFQYYNSTLTELAFERVVMESNLRAALENEEFVVYYQAQVNGVTNTIIGMEALVRWQHPIMGLVSPSKFIPLAESTGLIIELDRYVMKTAMAQTSQWYKEGLNPGVLAMNLAMKQLQTKDFILILKQLIKETNCKSEWLELEVAEGQIMTHPEKAILILQKISDLGIELAVDDFGTGYSSLAYLKRLPIDKLKIDQAFIRELPEDEEDVGITKAVIALAKSLHLKVIAEGVETKAQRDFLVENGCENIQGYFYSKPIPADEFENILRNGF
jgi:diguanylate cyclase (GGDEF)-like protein